MKKHPTENRIKPMNIVLIALVCFGLTPLAQAVVPPPGGGYANFTTAEGQNALFRLTTGAANTAVGSFSLESLANGSFNTAIGAGTLLFNKADSNTAIGTAALLLNTDGDSNTAVGVSALENNIASGNTAVGSNALLNNSTGGTLGTTQGFDVGPNTAVGSRALQSNTTASANTAVGYQALGSFTVGIGGTDVGACTAVGFQALANATGGGANNAFGYRALFSNTDGTSNSAFGFRALTSNTDGTTNTAVGTQALLNNTTGSINTALGTAALANNISGTGNTACGEAALDSNTTGGANTAMGESALHNNTTGFGNIALGPGAGGAITTGSNNIDIGTAGFEDESDTIRIGTVGTHGPTFIAGIFGTPIVTGDPVMVNGQGLLGTVASSRRFKKEIKAMDRASESILALKPVTFQYRSDANCTPQFGLIAEEVAEVNPDLVRRDKNGEIYTVRYDAVNAMLLNEFLKEHKKAQAQQSKIDQQQATIAELKSIVAQEQKNFEAAAAKQEKEIAALASGLQKVSARIEMERPTTKVVANNP